MVSEFYGYICFWFFRVNYTIQNHIGKSGQNHLLGKTKSLDK